MGEQLILELTGNLTFNFLAGGGIGIFNNGGTLILEVI